MANQHLILTVIGDDRPGLVEELASAIAAHDGNWLEASLAHLSGKFAGIVRVAVSANQVEPLKATLAKLVGLKVSAEVAAEEKSALAGRRLTLNLVGHDRIGIVREVSQVLARHAVNVEELATYTSSAPMSAEVLFHAEAELFTAPDFDARALKAELERLSDDLMVDITLGETL
ncbi:MAG: ACT domain-containing protein [Rhodocyclaceae bacterium]|nr:ACT domain-containing protein [Rhodocyclaceae bacterium]MDO9243276.1 ACT domain-containing protein [Rhodocyclaceae bacterium]